MRDAGGSIEGSFRYSFSSPPIEFGCARSGRAHAGAKIVDPRQGIENRGLAMVSADNVGFHCVSIQQVNPAARRIILKPRARARCENANLPAGSVPIAAQQTIQSLGHAMLSALKINPVIIALHEGLSPHVLSDIGKFLAK